MISPHIARLRRTRSQALAADPDLREHKEMEIMVEAAPERPAPILGMASIARMASNGIDLAPLKLELLQKVATDPREAGACLDISIIERLCGNLEAADVFQSVALLRGRRFSSPLARVSTNPFRLLALTAPGDFMSNTPLEFLVEGREVALEALYLKPDEDLPEILPDHDIAFVAVAEMDANQAILEKIARVAPSWPRPVVNQASNIARLTRDGAWRLLHDASGIEFPPNLRIDRRGLAAVANGELSLSPPFLADYPIIVRPVGSHAGQGLRKIDSPREIIQLINEQSASEFYVAPFIDYRSDDGLFRKFRVVLIDGAPYAVHMAISRDWMIHYLNADMFDNEANRAEEARFMASFDEQFATRHADALAEVHRRTDLDYVLLDCSETRDGKLLIFEVGTAMIVHMLDPAAVFPYKPPQMEKIFEAFERMLRRKACSGL